MIKVKIIPMMFTEKERKSSDWKSKKQITSQDLKLITNHWNRYLEEIYHDEVIDMEIHISLTKKTWKAKFDHFPKNSITNKLMKELLKGMKINKSKLS